MIQGSTKLYPTGVGGPTAQVVVTTSVRRTALRPFGTGGAVVTITPTYLAPVVPPPLPTAVHAAGPWTRPRVLSDPGTHAFILKYDGDQIDLPYPILQDTQTLKSTLINRRTRGGKKRVYRNLQWYTLHVYTYTFHNLRETLKDDLLTFLDNSLGDPIQVIDHLDNVYNDMYITEVGPVTEVHDDGCSYSIDLTMQVVR